MKRFIISVLSVSVFFLGLGALVENVGARFKSDEKALELIRKARQAVGGDSAIASVRSMRIAGTTTKTITIGGETRTETGETEIAMQLPDKMMRMVKLGKHDGGPGQQIVDKQVDVVVVRGKDGNTDVRTTTTGTGTEGPHKIILQKKDGSTEEIVVTSGDKEVTTADGKKVVIRRSDGGDAHWSSKEGNKHVIVDKEVSAAHHGSMRQNEMLRTTLSLLLSAPEGMDVNYTYGGEQTIDGTACNLVIAAFGGNSYKLYLGRDSNLPVMLAYTGTKMPAVVMFKKNAEAPADGAKDKDVMILRKAEAGHTETAEFQVRFSDYRSTGGIQLPYKWVTTVGGTTDEIFDVGTYEINPANIAEKFQNYEVKMKSPKQIQ